MASPASPLSSDQRRDRDHPDERSCASGLLVPPRLRSLLAPCAPDAHSAMRMVTFAPALRPGGCGHKTSGAGLLLEARSEEGRGRPLRSKLRHCASIGSTNRIRIPHGAFELIEPLPSPRSTAPGGTSPGSGVRPRLSRPRVSEPGPPLSQLPVPGGRSSQGDCAGPVSGRRRTTSHEHRTAINKRPEAPRFT
jgi:hypothetical protein